MPDRADADRSRLGPTRIRCAARPAPASRRRPDRAHGSASVPGRDRAVDRPGSAGRNLPSARAAPVPPESRRSGRTRALTSPVRPTSAPRPGPDGGGSRGRCGRTRRGDGGGEVGSPGGRRAARLPARSHAEHEDKDVVQPPMPPVPSRAGSRAFVLAVVVPGAVRRWRGRSARSAPARRGWRRIQRPRRCRTEGGGAERHASTEARCGISCRTPLPTPRAAPRPPPPSSRAGPARAGWSPRARGCRRARCRRSGPGPARRSAPRRASSPSG